MSLKKSYLKLREKFENFDIQFETRDLVEIAIQEIISIEVRSTSTYLF